MALLVLTILSHNVKDWILSNTGKCSSQKPFKKCYFHKDRSHNERNEAIKLYKITRFDLHSENMNFLLN